jgi:hypothetical protein
MGPTLLSHDQPASRTRATVIGLGVVVAVFLLPARADFLKPVIPMEEGSVLVYPERVLAGAIPNRDFETMYGPANVWLLAGVYQILGQSVTIERTIGLLYRLISVLALFFIARRYGIAAGIAAGLLATLLTAGTWAVAYAWFGGLALATWSLFCASDRRRLLIGGILGGLALAFRPDLVLAIGALVLTVRERRFIVGVLLGSIPIWVLLALAGFTTVVNGLIADPIVRDLSGARFPIPWTSPLLWLVLGSTLLLLAAGLALKRRAGDQGLFMCALFSIGLLPQAFQRPDGWHLISAGCVAVALLPVAATVFAAREYRTTAVILAGLVALSLTWASALPVAMESIGQTFGMRSPASYPLTFDGRTVLLPAQEQVRWLSELMTEITRVSDPGDRIFVGPRNTSRTVYNDTFLYYLLPQLTPSTYYLEMNPGTADSSGSRLAEDVSSADVVVLTTRYDDWAAAEALATGHTGPSVLDRKEFCFRNSYGPWELFVRCTGDTGREHG